MRPQKNSVVNPDSALFVSYPDPARMKDKLKFYLYQLCAWARVLQFSVKQKMADSWWILLFDLS